MASKYFDELEALIKKRCEICHGIGTCNDAEPGDISCNEWPCKKCNGTGMIEDEANGK